MTTTKATPSTSLVLPNVIAKLALMAQEVTILSDGTKTFTFKGFVSPMDAHLIYLAAMTGGDGQGSERHTQHHVVFSGGDKGYSWSAKQNYIPKGGKFYITFVMNDYTIPMQNQKALNKLFRSFELANAYLEYVILHPEDWYNHQEAIESTKEVVMMAARNLADFQV